MLGHERNPAELRQRYAELVGVDSNAVKLPGKLV